jgi:hypothetical protein
MMASMLLCGVDNDFCGNGVEAVRPWTLETSCFVDCCGLGGCARVCECGDAVQTGPVVVCEGVLVGLRGVQSVRPAVCLISSFGVKKVGLVVGWDIGTVAYTPLGEDDNGTEWCG